MPCARPTERTGIVLAGGRSRRMGRDKAELDWRPGQTLLDRATEILGQAGCQHVIVSGRRTGHDCVPDLETFPGPLGGLQAVLETRDELDHHLLLVLPVDMPLLAPTVLQRLAEAAAGHPHGAVMDSGPLPMALNNGRDLRQAIKVLMNGEGKHSLRELAAALDLAVVPARTGDHLENINRPEDLALARRERSAADD